MEAEVELEKLQENAGIEHGDREMEVAFEELFTTRRHFRCRGTRVFV
jgi:hypothetical protein